jgi:hypothetical protein
MNKLLLFLIFIGGSFSMQSQETTAEIFSPRIKNNSNGSGFYFRILNVSQADFNSYVQKSKSFAGLNTFKSGYSEEYKIGSIYYNSTSHISLTQISQLLKFLSLNRVLYDGKQITAEELKNQKIIVVEKQNIPAEIKR